MQPTPQQPQQQPQQPAESWPGPQQPWPPTKPPTRRRWLPWAIIIGVIVLGLGGCVSVLAVIGASVDTTDTTAPAAVESEQPSEQPAKQAPAEPGIGDPARDGQFEFVVRGIDYTSAGVLGGERAQGVFVIAELTIRNTGTEARMFDASNVYAYQGETRYDADGAASLVANEGSTATFLETINPGNRIDVKIVFDVPKGAKLDRLELHDSPFSGGVTVRLR